METNSNTIRIYLLGKFEIRQAENVITRQDWTLRKAAALLQRLAYERRLLKDQAIEFLWPETDLASGSNNLYRVIYSVRQTIDTFLGESSAKKIFSYEDGVLNLNEEVWVDTADFERLCQKVQGESSDQRLTRLKEAVNLYEGDFLPDERYDDWALIPRETLIRLFRDASHSLAKFHLEHADFQDAIEILLPLLSQDGVDEGAHRELMRAYALSGRRHDAIRQYQLCVDILASELDISPAQETTDLYNQILSGALISPTKPDVPIDRHIPKPVQLDSESPDRLAGRQSELNKISSSLRRIRHGQGSKIFIAGESGIGKTQLAIHGVNLAAQNEMVTIMGAAYEQEGRLPLQPFVEAFDHFLALQGRSLDENPITQFQHLNAQDTQQDQWALFKATVNFILDIARESPLVFLIDDLHAADETSLQLFHYLSRQTRTAPVALMATYRIDSPTTKQFSALLSALYREGLSQTIVLEALPKEAIQEILEYVLKGKVSDILCQEIYEITSGNPYFTQEMGKALVNLGKLEMKANNWSLKTGERLSVPENLSALLREKISHLDESVEIVLSAAAVIGMEFDYEIIRNAISLSNGEILDALDSALDGHLIEETSAGYRFRHPLIRRSLYENFSRARRENQHTRVAEAIESVFSSKPGGVLQKVESLAYHYDSSDRRAHALPYLIQAGENAVGVYAFGVAVDYFERALSLMDHLGVDDPSRRWYLLEMLGWWYKVLADTPRSVDFFEKALSLEPKTDWRPANQDLVRLHCGAAAALITVGDIDTAEVHINTALGKMDEGEDAPEYADLWYNLAQLFWHRNEYQQAMQVAQRSLAVAQRLNKPDAIARAFEMLALACHSLGEWQTGMAYEQQRAELTGADLDVTDAFDAHL